MPDAEQRAENVLVGLDETVNAALGGSPRETISGTVGRAAEAGEAWAEDIAEPFVNAIMHNSQHCQEQAAIEQERREAEAGIKS